MPLDVVIYTEGEEVVTVLAPGNMEAARSICRALPESRLGCMTWEQWQSNGYAPAARERAVF